jgi:glycosyltransferase involved in cell wall biosynthesis
MIRVAIVHDALCVYGGAERLAFWMAKAFPEAPIFTSVYLPDQTFQEFRGMDIRTLPFANHITSEEQFKSLLPLWFHLLRRLRFKEFDVVLSSSTYLAKYVHPAKGVLHKSYIHAPFRLLWKPESYTLDSIPNPCLFRPILKVTSPFLRNLDRRLTRQIPQIATSCSNMAREIQNIYGRNSVAIHPPINITEFPLATTDGDYYLSVSRLIFHKRVDLTVQACTQLHKKLIVVGDGLERKNLERLAGDTVRFVGRVSDDELKRLYLNSKALIFPGEEDYGITPLEAQACGRPVIAFGRGGVLETVWNGRTGLYFMEQTIESLKKCIRDFEDMNFQAQKIREWAKQFDAEGFIKAIREFVLEVKT